MRKTILAAVLGLAMTGSLPALDLALHGGYTSFNMGSLNRANSELIGYGGDGYSRPIESGVVVGADLTIPTGYSWLQAGLRTEFMQSNMGETKADSYNFSITDQAALSDLLVGLKASTSGTLSLGLGAWFGYGYATLNQVDFNNSVGQSGLYMQSLPVTQLEGRMDYHLGQHLKLSLTGGYRWAFAEAIYDDQHHPLLENGNLWWWGNAVPVSVDFGGITGQGSISYSF
jgi:hypothetical protein